ncbi:MAG: alanine--tRNA ligase [Halobacteriovoraceae bacterium]|nr:alanine--tRNA ligase [Halobacteriovoraceae bacterium]
MKVQEIRERFTKYFETQGHEKVSSSPLVPINDDTLLFANAGMNQFKDYFTGKAKPASKRATTIQKVVRAGGKHNDLENVGFTARHHTFFEMLGNFSFGDYFKKEAIEMAWHFLTKELNLPAEKLFVTVHTSDDEAEEIWNKHIGIPLDRIFRKGDKDNFWEMGDVGPCGPCSEIFFDHGEKFTTPGFKPEKGQDILDDEMRYVEIWNLVFMQFEKDGSGSEPKRLPNPSIDTGMGLERVAAALQGVYWNYDTDAFTPIIKELEKVTGKSYSDKEATNSMRVVADHIRSCTMLITDGVIPSNEGRGYVLRRIIRRAIRHMRNLGAPEGSFSNLSKVVIQELGTEYPQNKANQSMAEKFLHLEEKKFLETLDMGIKYLEDSLNKNTKNNIFDGREAFKLYDTYGFPLDLTQVILQEKGIQVDEKAFDTAMEERKEDSRKSWKGALTMDDKVFHTSKEKCGETKFLGYSDLSAKGELLDIITLGDDKEGLVFDQTPFYAEGGGQVGDTGTVNDSVNVLDTQKPVDGLFVHFVESGHGLKIGTKYDLSVNEEKRNLTMRNHSATHLLQSALIKVLGDHVKQSGSMVNSERLRFDFTHMQGMTAEEITQIEDLVNEEVMKAVDVNASVTSMDNALKMGALALFGEKYGDDVRVLKMGEFSTELCGGTHVTNTSEIGLFTIISESSLSTGVRRIEATTSKNALKRLNSRSKLLKEIELLTSSSQEKVVEKYHSLMDELKKSQKEVKNLKSELTSKDSEDLFSNPEILKGDIPFKYTPVPEGSDLRKLSDLFMDKNPNGVVLLTMEKSGKLAVLLRSGKKTGVKCNDIFKETLPILGGRGGGRPDMAQGSGEDAKSLDKFINETKAKIQAQL